MLKKITIWLIITTITLLSAYEIYDKYGKPVPKNDTDSAIKDVKNAPILLNYASHVNAQKEWGLKNGFDWDKSQKRSVFNKNNCLKTGLYWDDNNKVCIVMPSSNVLKKNACDNSAIRLPYYGGILNCKKEKDSTFCNLTTDAYDNPKNYENGKLPTCTIKPSYCLEKGLNYTNIGGKNIGDCSNSDTQAIVESILGKTITRTYKNNLLNMRKECCHKILSYNCVSGIGTFSTTGGQIILKSGEKYMQDLVDNFKKQCSGDFTENTQKAVNCIYSIEKFLPGVYLTEFGTKLADSFLTSIFGWTGMPDNVIQRGCGYAVKYGIVAFTAILHFGETAVVAIDKAGDLTVAFLNKMSFGLGADLSGIGEVVMGLHFITMYGSECARAICVIGKDAVQIMMRFTQEGMKIINSCIGAVMHPIQFCKNFIKEMSDPKKAFEDCVVEVLKAMKTLKLLSKQVLHMFLDSVKIAGQILSKTYDAIKKELSNLENGIETGAKGLGNAISSIF
jgi:hypothetical protein